MLIDTHCHLDAAEFDTDRSEVIGHALEAGVQAIVIPAVERANFAVVRELAGQVAGGAYALGIHPLYVQRADDADLDALRDAIRQSLGDPRFVAIGEIGLDFFVPEIASGEPRARQERFYAAQLAMAAEFKLPVLLHVRKSQDILLKYLRRHERIGGIAHAFNGSAQQAQAFVEQGFALGLGGAMTYERALQIRRHATDVDLRHLVLETDAPDIPPAWLHPPQRRNRPGELARIAQVLAGLRGITPAQVAQATTANALRVLPRLSAAILADD
ncbi:DNAase [Achromobacter xylosoxidans]|jgi:TatD DNase family protein|uniref:Metal-dependent hydrolase YjjV n=3 Tax=Achromobacter TaxID=222 RepID=A0ABM8LUG1_9BURK|nr:TatD family hydrolase [Achromobacter ruhlandii]AKP89961.1 Putative deoxyribonuclease YjjV [Achromobacter xylosoxidans]AOU93015.1 TatD family DNase [Achromobacter ruhlandii]MCI1840049.1 TatD family hydrolase [Achromobacter ruhlandii]MCZ8432478.1 TatD family hydrolase [Achromobacter ruhlandii]MDC6089531.1 TatD family hydrolase [Achromobacter ruhlandii]